MKSFKNLLLIFIISAISLISCENEPVDSTLLNQTNNQNQNTSNDHPVITTKASTNISYASALSGGEIISEGQSNIISRGVVWNITPNPTIYNFKKVSGSGIGNYSSSITNLIPNTTYYVRAYATNHEGTTYGNQITFTTLSLAGTYDLTNFNIVPGVDHNNDGISSLNYLNELPESYFGNDKIILNNDSTFSLYGTDINFYNVPIVTTPFIAYNDYVLTGTWTITGNILKLDVLENGPNFILEYLIIGNTLKDLSHITDNPVALGYVNGEITYINLQSEETIYTKI